MVSGKNLVFQVTENQAPSGVVPTYHDVSPKERITMIRNDFRFLMYHLPQIYLLMHTQRCEGEADASFWPG
jgi:hypothetical protein